MPASVLPSSQAGTVSRIPSASHLARASAPTLRRRSTSSSPNIFANEGRSWSQAAVVTTALTLSSREAADKT